MNANDQVTSLLESSTLVLKAGSVDPSGAPEAQQGDSVIKTNKTKTKHYSGGNQTHMI